VEPSRNLSLDFGPVLQLRIDDEVLSVGTRDGSIILHSWPFHRILCWGYSATSFQWRAYASAEDEAVHGGADAAAAAAALTAHELSRAGETQAPSSAMGEDARAVCAYSVSTTEGSALEAALMARINALIGSMNARGVPPKDFAALLRTLNSLNDEGLTEQALSAVRQMSLGRCFDARQAVALVNCLGTMSPFERIDGLCALWPKSLLHPASLPTILLDCFDDDGDRENVCHRLGVGVSPAGDLLSMPTSTSRRYRG
jgi:hypothetical protein